MASDLTPELRQALESSGEPLELVDRQTNEHFVVIRVEIYERLKALLNLADPAAAEETAELRDWAQRSGYFDPAMDAYDSLTPPIQ